ncbi:MAG: M48 family metallopeptidase [Bacteroidales bacterium]|nr:M48 family metallopeptidase [Bacteroidales bacterium]
MKKFTIIVFALALIAFGCSKVPFSGRKQLRLLPSTQMNSMAFDAYGQFMNEHQLTSNQQYKQMLNNVGDKMSTAITNYLTSKNMKDRVAGFQWEYNVVKDNQVNAWAMPGGKIVFYEGIMPICNDETGIAVVMGHEIAHIISKHGNERMTQGLLAQMGGIALDMALEKEPEQTRNLFMAAYGVGAQVGMMLPYSRTHEKEADRIGLIVMAMAGYNPSAAVEFWQRMGQNGGSQIPEFLSTHPSYDTRIQELKKHLPEAMKYYQGSSNSIKNTKGNTKGDKKGNKGKFTFKTGG